MKIKNIFFAAILVLAGFSCSMEDDAIMNDVEKGIEEATEAYTVLDFGVAFNEMATKASTTVVPGEDRPATLIHNNQRGRFKTPPYFLSIKRSLSFLSQLKGVPLNLPFGIFTT